MLSYEETGFLLGAGDRMRRERALAQQVVDQACAQRDEALRISAHNYQAWEAAQSTVESQAEYIRRLEAIIRNQAAGRA
ncbi:hypothetical protein [Chenggangzhangella methanolivorans]|uniref:Uncharacterized protein n=1 Tax=Chenggangzhangella methanolivorans TaxID=1437009 RepID=A0A9E6RG08_9HYPH|nr:hypothetical protein [Chenggangzhangella methanolivorans]QZO00696.1 hypothetical protein K6K41_03040 [Chenggangzhangella methanolivorans]